METNGPHPNELLVQARIAHHFTQQQLAELLQISPDTVRAWERGRRTPSLTLRARLCEVLSKSPVELGLEVLDHRNEEYAFDEQRHRAYLNRRRMIQRVRSIWIDGVLHDSLHQTTLLELGLQEAPDALVNPWRLAVQETDRPERALPSGTSILQMYENADGELLLLGEPGAGKTTLLLELARVLLLRAEQDVLAPIPVLFHLSSWSAKQADLAEWLADELAKKYRVPTLLARAWLQTDQIALLLDGLDETAEDARLACVRAITLYQQNHVRVPLVVCCRSVEYTALPMRFALQRAVLIQALTRDQIDAYVSRAGEQLAGVRHALAHDPELLEMIQTPLMLHIVALAYQGREETAFLFPASHSKEEQRQAIFQTYIERMLKRRSVAPYQPSQTLRRLSWLARQMQAHGQTEFYLEHMQPDWLPDTRSYQRYRLTVIRWVLGFTALIKAGLLACFRGDSFPQQPGLFFWVGGGKGNSVLEWMAPGLGGWLQGATSMLLIYALVTILMPVLGDLGYIPTLTKKALQQGMVSGLRSGLLVAVIFSVGAGFVYGRTGGNGVLHGIEDGVFAGLIYGLQRGLVALLRSEEQASQQAHQPFPIPRRARFLNSVIFGCCAFVGFTGVYAWQTGGINQLILLYGMVIGCLFGIIYGVSYGTARLHDLDLTIEPAEVVAWSWLAVWNHLGEILTKGIVLGATILVVAVMAVTAMSSLSYGIDYGFKYGLIYGLIVGLIVGVAGIVVGLLVSGWSSSLMDDRQQLVKPNEGIHRSLRHAAFAACLFGPIGGIASGLVSSLAFWAGGIHAWYVLGLGFAIVFTVTFALEFLTVYGGVAVVEHAFLRWYLWRNHLIPWKYAAFLDDATRRIFLRKRGEGYLFMHRLVLEHFAQKDAHDQRES